MCDKEQYSHLPREVNHNTNSNMTRSTSNDDAHHCFPTMPSRAGTQATQQTEHTRHGRRHHHHHHHRRPHAFPPKEYIDLTRTDISFLAPILLPKAPEETRSEYEKKTKKLIAELPAHLHCKHPLLSSFCSLHGKISPGPVISLFNSLRAEIEDEVPETWGLLVERKQLEPMKRGLVETVQNLAVLWMGKKVFAERFGKDPPLSLTNMKASGCAACTLVLMAADFQTQVAMASLFIGRVDAKIWTSSKRVTWFLEWTAARMPESMREDSKKLIWEVGKKFRLTRIGSEDAKSKKRKSRLDQEEEDELGPGTATYPFSLEPEKRGKRGKGPRKMLNTTAQDDVDAQEREAQAAFAQLVHLRDTTRELSVYSRTMSETEQVDLSITDDIEDIVSMYNHSSGFAFDEGSSHTGTSTFADEHKSRHEPSGTDASRQENQNRPGRLMSMIRRELGSWHSSTSA